ncbi:MAG TPA: glutamine synthetase family protein [Propionibacteriaceae bacterium]|nr:glutamine synthetase family protein [Propionibacteriaceae bacterium]
MTELRNARHLSVHDLRRRINEGDVDTVVVAFTDVQGRLQGTRFHAPYFAEQVLEHGTEAPGYLLAVDVEMNITDRDDLPSVDRLNGEMKLLPDLQTIRLLHHQPGTVMVQCDVVGPDETPIAESPRAILKQQLVAAASREYAVLAGIELEFVAFHTSYQDAWQSHYRDLVPASQYNGEYSIMNGSRTEPLLHAIRNSIYAAGIDIESVSVKRSLGQHAISCCHADALATADNHVVVKTIAKEIAAEQGKSVTFMATYDQQQGNSCHLRLSLRGADGSIVFWNNRGSTALCGAFVAGVLATLHDFALLYAPNINSYKRFAGESLGSSANSWGLDDRTSAVRVMGRNESARVENRTPGADANPYLALAAMIAGGLYGIDHDLELGPALGGSAHSSEFSTPPHSLREARQVFGTSQLARMTFGDQVVDHYAALADVELAAFEAVVTDWELRRSFERM